MAAYSRLTDYGTGPMRCEDDPSYIDDLNRSALGQTIDDMVGARRKYFWPLGLIK